MRLSVRQNQGPHCGPLLTPRAQPANSLTATVGTRGRQGSRASTVVPASGEVVQLARDAAPFVFLRSRQPVQQLLLQGGRVRQGEDAFIHRRTPAA